MCVNGSIISVLPQEHTTRATSRRMYGTTARESVSTIGRAAAIHVALLLTTFEAVTALCGGETLVYEANPARLEI